MCAACLALPLSGCDKQISQRVTGTLAGAKGPASNVELRLYPSYQKCAGSFIEAKTDDRGSFTFHTESTRGGHSVVVQELALCTKDVRGWVPLWSIITGGGAPLVKLTCRAEKNAEGEYCESDFIYGASDA